MRQPCPKGDTIGISLCEWAIRRLPKVLIIIVSINATISDIPNQKVSDHISAPDSNALVRFSVKCFYCNDHVIGSPMPTVSIKRIFDGYFLDWRDDTGNDTLYVNFSLSIVFIFETRSKF